MKHRVLVVDDSVVVRRVVSTALASHPSIEVAGSAPNGRIALAKLEQLNPDAVVLDIEMPEMDGLTALAEIRRQRPRLPVVMFSTLTERGASATFKALQLGASDYVTKPSSMGSLAEAVAYVRDELVPRVVALCGRNQDPVDAAPVAVRSRVPGRVDVVAVGVSTGGPNALMEVLPALPADFPVPVVVTQHMPPLFTRMLAERLDAHSPLSVSEGADGMVLAPGTVAIAPGGRHMIVERRGERVVVVTNEDPPENSCRPAVDPLFRSVAAAYGPRVLAVVLTGMGSDGLRGCEAVVASGGHVVVQDEATSVVWGMPGYVARAGLADAVLPLGGIAGELVARVSFGRVGTLRVGGAR